MWLWFTFNGGNTFDLWPITVGVATTLSLVIALLAGRGIPLRVALLLIVFVPLAVKPAVSAILGGAD